MKLENLAITTRSMRKGDTLRDFFEECVQRNVPGLPYTDVQNEITGRLSIRDVYKRMAVPDNLLRVIDSLGDQTDRLDLPEMQVAEALRQPVETYLLDNIPTVSPRSSIVKTLTLMEAHNSSYIFLIDNGNYQGVVTRMTIARRMLACVMELEAE